MATYVYTSDKKSHEESVRFRVYFAVYCNHKKIPLFENSGNDLNQICFNKERNPNLLVRRDKKFCEKLIHANPLFYKERQNQCFGNIKKAYAPLWR